MRRFISVAVLAVFVSALTVSAQDETSESHAEPSSGTTVEEPSLESTSVVVNDVDLVAPISQDSPNMAQEPGDYRSEGPRGPSTRDVDSSAPASTSYNGRGRRVGRRCWVRGGYVAHGWRGPISYINPCWKKQCHDGTLVPYGDGCYYKQQCYPLNRTFYYKCKPLRCSKSSQGGVHSYNVRADHSRSSRARCEDANGRCRWIGETNFRAVIQGRLYDNCQCSANGHTLCYRM